MNMFKTNTDAIYRKVAKNGLGAYRPFMEDGKVYVMNALGEKVECSKENGYALSIDSWKKLDDDISSVIRTGLNVFSDFQSVGTVDLGSMDEALGTFLYINQMRSDSGSANLSMTGRSKISNDEPLTSQEMLPLPMINADFRMDVRTMNASGRGAYGMGRNVSMDTSEAQNEARRTSEELEDLAIVGGGAFAYGGHSVYGMTTAPNRNTTTFAVKWSTTATITSPLIFQDVRAWINALYLKGFGGDKSLMLYIPKAYNIAMSNPWSTSYDGGTVKEYLLRAFPELIDIKTAFRLTADECVLIEMRPRTVKIVNGFAPTPISWMSPDGLEYNWKLLTLQIPKFYSDYAGTCGILHASYSS